MTLRMVFTSPEARDKVIRDFGAVEFQGHRIFWKIDVYAKDSTFSWGSETPWDAQQSFRVVTIMLASDW